MESARTDEPVVAIAARQPIYARALRLHAYELLFRSDGGAAAIVDDTAATRTVLNNGLIWLGLGALSGGRPLFVNFGEELLLSNEILELPPARIVIEVLESVPPTDEVIEALQELRARGFRIALDDFTWDQGREALLPVVDVVKLDFGLIEPGDRSQSVERVRALRFAGPRVLAEKVETESDFDQARELDVDYLQGWLWGMPQLLTGLQLTPSSLAGLNLVKELRRGAISQSELVSEIKRDPALVQGLLRYVNSGLFRWTQPISSLEHAVSLLGQMELLRWAALITAQQLSRPGLPSDAVTAAVTRGRFCELAANELQGTHDALDYFLIGLFSLADCLFGVPLKEALEHVPLPAPLLEAISDAAGEPGLLLRAARAVERGNTVDIVSTAQALGLATSDAEALYLEAARWGADSG